MASIPSRYSSSPTVRRRFVRQTGSWSLTKGALPRTVAFKDSRRPGEPFSEMLAVERLGEGEDPSLRVTERV
jgi:hypothetical protein